MRIIAILFSLIFSLGLIGCGDDPYASANDRSTSSALEAQQEVDHNPEELMAPMEEVEPEPVNPCKKYTRMPGAQNREFADSLFTKGFVMYVDSVRACDNHGEYFSTDGYLRGFWGSPLLGMQALARDYSYLGDAFESLPVLKRREVLEPAMNALAPYVVEYVHPKLVQKWLLDLKWDDIESINPDWYHDIDVVMWPEDETEPMNIDGYGEISRIELWIKMFWRRRGELIFTTAQNAVKSAQKNSTEAPTGS